MLKGYSIKKISRKAFLGETSLPGVYIYWDTSKHPIYVGKAVNLKNRLNSYRTPSLEAKTSKLMDEAKYFSTIKVDSEFEALLLEAKLVRLLNTKYNIQLKDDKHPLYIKITNDKYPLIQTARRREYTRKSVEFLGPFPSSLNVKFILKFLRRVIPYADHLPGRRSCIYSQIGLCNPCPSNVELERDPFRKKQLRRKYLTNIRLIRKLLSGKVSKVRELVVASMIIESKKQNFEEAAKYRDILNKLNYITKPRIEINRYLENPNLLADQRNSELNDLRTLLNTYFPRLKLTRIECFDVAHLAGTHPTASMVVAIEGVQEHALYKRFRIRQPKGASDTDSMIEIANRRFHHVGDWGKPDLIVVDGGKTQLTCFLEVFSQIDVPVVGLAKRQETLIIKRAGLFDEIRLSGLSLHLLQRLRDEAHRFARVYHHKLVNKDLFPDGS